MPHSYSAASGSIMSRSANPSDPMTSAMGQERRYAADARRRVVANQWERRRGSDGLVRAQVPSDVAYDFFMLQYRRELESRPAPVKEFEAAMDALCRAFGQRQIPVRRSPQPRQRKSAVEAAERARKYGPQLDAMVLLAG